MSSSFREALCSPRPGLTWTCQVLHKRTQINIKYYTCLVQVSWTHLSCLRALMLRRAAKFDSTSGRLYLYWHVCFWFCDDCCLIVFSTPIRVCTSGCNLLIFKDGTKSHFICVFHEHRHVCTIVLSQLHLALILGQQRDTQ